jgi:hypothetical protein
MCPYYLYVSYLEGRGRARSGSYRRAARCAPKCEWHWGGYRSNQLRDQVSDQVNDHVDLGLLTVLLKEQGCNPKRCYPAES